MVNLVQQDQEAQPEKQEILEILDPLALLDQEDLVVSQVPEEQMES